MNGHEKLRNQSKQWIEDSLLELMEKKPYQDITIGQIADHAGLSRRTFYRVFKNKEEVMDSITSGLSQQYEEHILSNTFTNFEFPMIAHIFFSFFEEHYKLLRLFQKNGLEYQILKCFNYYLPQICDHIIKDSGRITGITQKQAEYIKCMTRFNCGGFFNLLLMSLENEEELNASGMEEFLISADKFLGMGKHN